tara:strand:- start:1762 stop:2682 length:921 start_codon:yes stop_codon:yes gene_type:complete
MKNILVTGGAGFVGTNLIKKLLDDGYNVVSTDNYSTGKKQNEQDGCKYYEIDLSDKVSIDSLESIRTVSQIPKFDIIFHLAAKARIVPSIQNPTKSLFNNIDSTINVLEYARLHNIPVVYAGSSSAHGDIYANPYTFTKWNGEELCKLYESVYDLPIAICRFYNVYGDGQLTEGAYCTVLGIFERLYKEGKALTVTGDGEQRRDFTYVGDIVDGLIKCGRSLLIPNAYNAKVSGETFELGNGNNYSILDLVDAFGETEVEYIAPRPGEVRESLNTDTKAYTMLGWKPKGDIIEYIKKTYVNNRNDV